MYYDCTGNPITMEQWALLCVDANYKRVLKTDLEDGRSVSTVWLGLNHQFGDGPPLIFETMVFPDCAFCDRYATEEEARAGHARILALTQPTNTKGG